MVTSSNLLGEEKYTEIANISFAKHFYNWCINNKLGLRFFYQAAQLFAIEIPTEQQNFDSYKECLISSTEQTIPCIEYFLQMEYQDQEYMATLLTEEEYAAYLKDINSKRSLRLIPKDFLLPVIGA